MYLIFTKNKLFINDEPKMETAIGR